MVSWAGTADVASQAWLNHTTFDRYTEQTLELSAQMLSKQADQLSESTPRHSPGIDSAVAAARRSMLEIARLIRANDAPDAQVELDSLRAAKRQILAESDRLNSKQQ